MQRKNSGTGIRSGDLQRDELFHKNSMLAGTPHGLPDDGQFVWAQTAVSQTQRLG
jgi:hypothetical protein